MLVPNKNQECQLEIHVRKENLMENQTQLSKPKSVDQAVVLIFISAGLSTLLTIIMLYGLQTISVRDAFWNLISIGLLFLIASNLKRGKTWAWLLYVALVILSVLMIMLSLITPQVYQTIPTWKLILNIILYILEIAAMILLLSKKSRTWFNSFRKRKSSS
jgi:hypothetical protein